jgi:hypothetical protein
MENFITFLITKARVEQAREYHYSVDPPLIIPVQQQIKLLGVVVDETLSLIIHAQYAASRAMKALGSFLYLRKGLKGIPPTTARHIASSSSLPKLL